MPQRYNITDPSCGANPYQTYPNIGFPTAQSPSQRSQLGISAGTKFLGNLNTQWMLVDMAAGQASVAAGGTIYANPASTPPFAGTTTSVAGGVTGTVLVAIPATSSVVGSVTGVWAEVSGQTLNTAMLLELPGQNPGEADGAFKRRVAAYLLQQGLNEDGTVMTEAQRAAAEKALYGDPAHLGNHGAKAKN